MCSEHLLNRQKTNHIKIQVHKLGSCLILHLHVFESSANVKFELEESPPIFLETFSLFASLLCLLLFFDSLLATGTHLYIFMVVSPIVTHFFSLLQIQETHLYF